MKTSRHSAQRTESGKLERRAIPGPALHFRAVLLESPKAIVGIVPGYADHAERYRHVQEAWAERGIASVAIDLRGHGRAEGARGYCSRWVELVDDAGELVRLIEDRARGVPAFLFGHSLGGLVATHVVLGDPSPWRGLMMSSPFFGIAAPVPAIKRAAARVASLVYPRFSLPTGIRGADVTRDEARARAYEEDPLVFKNATARWFVETQRAQRSALASARGITLPLRITFGEDDPVAHLDTARGFFNAAGSEDKSFHPLPKLRHEPLNEVEWRPVADGFSDWVLRTLR